MKFKIGDKVIMTGNLEVPEIQEGIISQMNDDIVKIGKEWFMVAFCWPYEYKTEVTELILYRAKLRKQLDDSMALVYQLRNKITLEQEQ